jgi:hypothetical protein
VEATTGNRDGSGPVKVWATGEAVPGIQHPELQVLLSSEPTTSPMKVGFFNSAESGGYFVYECAPVQVMSHH